MNEVVRDNFLQHHGILGMKWGERNGPPYPLDAEDHSSSEKKAGWKKSLEGSSQTKESKINDLVPSAAMSKKVKDIKKKEEKTSFRSAYEELIKSCGLTKEDVAIMAACTGLVIGTTAAVYGASYILSNPYHQFATDVNSNRSPFFYGLDKVLKPGFASKDSKNIGEEALKKGFKEVTASALSEALKNRSDKGVNPDSLIKAVRLSVVDPQASRRLSCWSASNAYFLGRLTGKEFACKDFQKLVDFNKFGQLYKNEISKFSIDGELMSNFVGKPGTKRERPLGSSDTLKLFDSIAKNLSGMKPNGHDGSIVGFINGAYHSLGCTHQWNFEITKDKVLHIADGYSGERYAVGKVLGGKMVYDSPDILRDVITNRGNGNPIAEAIRNFTRELEHYNRESIRFYAPSIDDLNLDALSRVVLGK